jgi:outer membrane murein-binding lipoprotein Lpp
MNNTPETDELVRSLTYEQLASTEKCYSEMRTLARRLESERDELQSDLEFRRGLFQLQEQQLNDVRKERDGWKAELEEQARLLGMSAERECDLRGKVERLERERDEVREQVKELTHENENLYRRLESVHEVYRLSSVCRTLKAENEQLKQQQP